VLQVQHGGMCGFGQHKFIHRRKQYAESTSEISLTTRILQNFGSIPCYKESCQRLSELAIHSDL
jgi:hypothetical protein